MTSDPVGQLTSRELGLPREGEHERVGLSRKGMVSTAHYLATEAGAEMLDLGGNAFDAAAAAAYALGVVEPAASGLGGQTMALIRTASGRTVALDGSSRAPNRCVSVKLTKRARLHGYRATTVPSTPVVLDYLRRKYGKLTRSKVLAPAIRLAEEGYPVSALQAKLTKRELSRLRKWGARELFLKDGQPYAAGEILKQPALAETFRRLSKKGIKDFYRGGIAAEIAADMEEHDGLIRLDDLAQIPVPMERRPIRTRYGHRDLYTFPPPAAGRALVLMVNLVQQLPRRWVNPGTKAGAVALAEVIHQAYLNRQDRPFDANLYPQVSEKRMLSFAHAKELAGELKQRIEGRGETTHLSVMDADGNAIALTQSIERVYGSCAASPKLGFLYNNYMSAFETQMEHPYFLRPNAVPWASVAPTIILEAGEPWLAIGSPGSARISSAILQTLMRLERGSAFEAVSAPRLHCSLDGVVSIEVGPKSGPIIEALKAHGFQIDERERYSFYLGCIQLVMREGTQLIGVADPRRDGAARGPRK